MNLNKKFLIACAAAIAIFITITCIYFRLSLDGKHVLYQNDVRQFKGAAKEIQDYRAENNGAEALWTNSMFSGMPAFQISVMYANRALSILNTVFQCFLPQPLGMVVLYFVGFFILLLCLKIDPWLAIVGAIAFGFSSYLFVIIDAGHNTQAVALGYAAPLFGGVILIFRQKWLQGFIVTTLFMGLELYSNHPQITYYTFLLIGLYLLGELIGYIREKKIKDFSKAVVILLAALTIGTLPNVGNLWTTAEYGKYTTRGPSELTIQADGKKNDNPAALKLDYITDYSYGVDESFTLLISSFKGGHDGANRPTIGSKPELMKGIDEQYYNAIAERSFYFGDTTPVYAGCLVVLLSFAGLFIIKNRIKWPLLIASLFALMLAWGKNFPALTDFFFHNFPAYNKFRAVSMLMTLVELILPLLAILTLNQIIEDHGSAIKEKIKGKFTRAQKGILIATGVIVLFLIVNLVAPTMFNTFHSEYESPEMVMENAKEQFTQEIRRQNPAISQQELNATLKRELDNYSQGYDKFLEQLEAPRIAFVKSDVLRTLLFVILGGGILLLFVYGKVSKPILIAGIGTLILIDLWSVDARYLNKDSYVPKQPAEEEFAKTYSDEYILNDKNAIDFRVLNAGANPFNNGAFSYYHKSIGGYHGAKLKKYQELIEFHLRREMSFASQIADARMPDSAATMYMNLKTPVLNMLNTRYIITQRNQDSVPFLNKAANGNAWFVSKIKWAPNADSEIVWTGDINTKTTAVINEKYKDQLKGSDNLAATWADIKLLEYKPNTLKYSFDSKSKQLVVFSEIYYPAGWNAYVDGVLTPHVAANYVLRAMMVPEGKHTIEFKFEPKSYYTGEKISFAGVILFYLSILGGIGFLIFKSMKKEKNNS